MDPFGDSHLRQLAEEMKLKQQYLKDYIINYGYDADDFNHYMSYQREGGENLDNWTLDELSQCIRDYYTYVEQQNPAGYQQENPNQEYAQQEQKIVAQEPKQATNSSEGKYQGESQSDGDQEIKQYTEADFEDLKAKNTPESRLFVQTGVLEKTPLSNKRITVRVIDGSLKSGGIFSASYLLFKINVEPIGWSIFRKDQDFYFLRKILLRDFPYVIIPPLPIKKKKESEKSIKKREKYLTRFMQGIMRSEDLKSS